MIIFLNLILRNCIYVWTNWKPNSCVFCAVYVFSQGINQKSRGVNVEFWNNNEINQSRTTNSTVYFPGAAGLVLARELLKSGNEMNVCIFEKENRLGGKIFDYRFPQAPNITVGKLPKTVFVVNLTFI